MKRWMGGGAFLVACALVAACTSDAPFERVLGPKAGSGGLHTVPVVAANYDRFQFPRGKSDYMCTITAQHLDGKYYHTVAWLRMPAAYRDPAGAVEVYSLRWQTAAGAPIAGANCKIPRTPAAEKFLHEKVFYIDPKTLRSRTPGPAPSMSISTNGLGVNMTTTLPTVVVIGSSPTWMSGSNSRSNPGFGASVPSWSPDPTYVEPGQPCTDGVTPSDQMIGVAGAESFLALSDVDACPKWGGDWLCFDFYISDCTIGGGTGAGDCRNQDAYATPGQSRAQVMIPLDPANADAARTLISPTCFRYRYWCAQPLGPEANQVHIGYTGNTIALTVRLQNALANIPPPIDGAFTITKYPDGSIGITGSRDAYPTLSIVRVHNGVNTILSQRDETLTRALSSWFGIIDNFAICIPRQ